MLAFKWHINHWPRMTLKAVTRVFQRKTIATSRKRWEIRSSLLLIINRKWHTPCQIGWKSYDLGWPWRPLRAIAAKRCEIRLRLLLIIDHWLVAYWLSKFKWNENHRPWIWHWRSLSTSRPTFGYLSDSWTSCLRYHRCVLLSAQCTCFPMSIEAIFYGWHTCRPKACL